MHNSIPAVLTIAGSDSSGGAGIQADLKTFLAHGVYGMSAITALTSQNTRGVTHVEVPSEKSVQTQIEAVFADIPPKAVKIGMLPSEEICRLVAAKLRAHNANHVVVDPVMVATSGARLSDVPVALCMETHLFPIAQLITPNRIEAEMLAGTTIQTMKEMEAAARTLAKTYQTNILLKGGHIGDTATDILCQKDGALSCYEKPRISTTHTHGTGCTYSSAIAANLAKGMELTEAVRLAKDWLHALIEAGSPVSVPENGPLSHGALL